MEFYALLKKKGMDDFPFLRCFSIYNCDVTDHNKHISYTVTVSNEK